MKRQSKYKRTLTLAQGKNLSFLLRWKRSTESERDRCLTDHGRKRLQLIIDDREVLLF